MATILIIFLSSQYLFLTKKRDRGWVHALSSPLGSLYMTSLTSLFLLSYTQRLSYFTTPDRLDSSLLRWIPVKRRPWAWNLDAHSLRTLCPDGLSVPTSPMSRGRWRIKPGMWIRENRLPFLPLPFRFLPFLLLPFLLLLFLPFSFSSRFFLFFSLPSLSLSLPSLLPLSFPFPPLFSFSH